MKQLKNIITILSALALLISFESCSEYEYSERFYSEDELLISEYLASRENLSECYAALQRTDFYTLLDLAGEYTFFAPTNEAFKAYYNDKGVSGLSGLSDEHLDSLFRNVIVEKLVSSIEFRAGRIDKQNLLGDFLIVNFGAEGLGNIFVNETPLSTIDMKLINGIVHESDEVISVVDNTLADVLQDAPEYSIFYQGMVGTGIIDSINYKKDNVKARYTLLVEDNDVFAKSGINSYEELVTTYSNTENLTDADNALNMFFRYHIVDWYLALNDFQSLMYPTVFQYPIVVEASGDYVINRHDEIIGEGEEADTIEVSQTLNYLEANVPAWNGIMHELNDVMDPYILLPTEVSFHGPNLESDSTLIIGMTEDLDPVITDSGKTYAVIATKEVGDYIEFWGPYLFPVSYYVYIDLGSWNQGTARLGLYVNDERVGETFVDVADEIFVGIHEVTSAGLGRIKIMVEGDHTDADKNKIRIEGIRFVPNL